MQTVKLFMRTTCWKCVGEIEHVAGIVKQSLLLEIEEESFKQMHDVQ